MACSSTCPTQDHESYGACMRDKGIKVAYAGQGGGDYTAQKKWDAELDLYRSAVKQGVQPPSTKTKDIRKALDVADKLGKPHTATQNASK